VILPHPVDTRAHQVVHQVILVRHVVEHLPHCIRRAQVPIEWKCAIA
jgi:hypothetical protein